jgi:hypothetical protein
MSVKRGARAQGRTYAGLLALLLLGCSSSREDAVPNVRLGMAPRDVRERFSPGGDGRWQTAMGQGDDTVLEWTSTSGAGAFTHARFEFHLGMLVAIRARATQGGARESVRATAKTVTAWSAGSSGTYDVTVLSRDCPTHHDEAETLASQSRANR